MSNETHLYAYCFASGEIGFGNPVPPGAIAFAKGDSPSLSASVEVVARHAKRVPVYLVPGMPEAPDEDAAFAALVAWAAWAAPFWREDGLIVLEPSRKE